MVACLAILAILTALAVLVSCPAPAAQEADPVALAEAFNAAWNAHDIEAVMALLGDRPTVEQVAPAVTGYDQSLATADTYGVPLPLASDVGATGQDPAVLLTGQEAVRQWIASLFARRHRVDAGNYQVAPDRVTWSYRASADPYQQTPGVGPTEGTVTATVHAGRFTTLAITADPGSVQRRELAVAAARRRTPAATGDPAVPAGVPQRGTPSVGPWILALGLSLVAVVVLALFKRPAQAP
jgi:hypothetical protein